MRAEQLSTDEERTCAVVPDPGGAGRGGHRLEGEVWPTPEVLVEQSPRYLRRRHDPHTGLAFLDLDAGT
ncbi:MAG TPA: hypothetical protein VFV66_31735 [Nonomuraea sp.]|nr:hypothetical protein [Nonomuraea sp.]